MEVESSCGRSYWLEGFVFYSIRGDRGRGVRGFIVILGGRV